jgi:hypothetical protein
MSDIKGNGYASSHDWKYLSSNDSHCSSYICDACGAFFVHAYNQTPDIFEALRAASLDSSMNPFPEVCKGVNIK